MRFGRTSLHSKGLMAPGRRRRKLRSDMRVSEQVVAGEKTFMVKVDDHVYLRFPELAWSVLQTFDGTRTESEVLEVLRETDPDLELSLEELEEFIEGTDPGVWEKTGAARNLAVLEKIRKERSERASDASLFYMYFSAWDPNAFFDRVLPYLRWLWTPQCGSRPA